MTRKTIKRWLVGLACAGVPLVTSATCNPRTGVLDFFRDDGGYYYTDAYYVDYYDDCFFFDCW